MHGHKTTTSHQPSIHRLARLVALACVLALLFTACDGGLPLPGVSNPFSTSEREALVAFYDAAGGPDWRNNAGWLEGDPIGSEIREPEGGIAIVSPDVEWFGVMIGGRTRTAFSPGGGGATSYQVPYVERLQLPGNGLTGELSSKLPGLDKLRLLDLRGNRLTGEIPPELGRMDSLTHLYLAGNQLTGEIPPQLEGMDGLYHLSLAHNRLTGEIPPQLADLGPILRELNLRGNQLTGEIPPELGSIRDLVTLDLRGNDLTGEIPPELGGFRQLHRLYLGGNRFTGCIPSRLIKIAENDLLLVDLPMCGTGALPSDETRQALVALYRSTGGDDWHDSTNWGNPNNIRWYGASNRGARSPRLVTMLNLPDNNLTGEIPPELGSIGSLRTIDLSGNNLTGRIPPELGNLDGLIVLLLGGNRFTGCIPATLHSIPNNDLLKLGLPYCALLDLYHATGGDDWFDNTSWLTDQTVDKWFGIVVVDQHDPDGDGHVAALRLPNNNLTGEVPPELGGFAGVNVLDLSGNNLTGQIPSELRLLFLTADRFDLSFNQLSGPIPADFWTVSGHGPKMLDLSDNQLSGPIPPQFGGMQSMISLDLSNNRLSGEIPPELGDARLSYLRLGGNRFTGCIPASLGRVQNNDLSELGLPWCGDKTPVDESKPALLALYNATGGDDWHNNNNWLSDQPIGKWFGVHWAVNKRVVGRLLLSDNNLTGEIPPELGSLGSLRVLDLSGNDLTGGIPAKLGDIPSIHTLDLSNNQLSGDIPPELWNISSFHTLDLSNNQLSGEIPPELGRLYQNGLRVLRLDRNNLTGEIPPELGRLYQNGLRVLRLDRNNLTGEIPPELADIRTLESLSIGGNQLTGCIPRALKRVRYNDFHFVGLPFCEK